MKKFVVYSVLLLIGIVLGGLIFSNSNENSAGKSAHPHIHESNNQEFWTCAMHPQVMKTEAGDCPICGMELIPATGNEQGLAANEIRMTKNAMALANIQTTIVGNMPENGENILSFSGKIVQNVEKKAIQASYFEGRIEKLNVNFSGQQINKGELLATIYAPELVAAQQELLSAASMKTEQPDLYQAVRNKLKLWKLSEKQVNSIEKSGKIQANFPIYATVSGTVDEVMSATGDYVKQGQPLLKISNLDNVWAEFDVYENQMSQLKTGDSVSITANAYPDKKFRAAISFIEPTLNAQSRTVNMRATLNNEEKLLKPGMFVTGKIKGEGENSGQLSIPASAVLWTGERSLIYVKTDKNAPVFEMREVTLGSKSGANYIITGGLVPGDEVVTHGTFTVDAAAQLQDKKSMMNRGRKTSEIAEIPMEFPEKFQQDFQKILPDYLLLKDAFVNGNEAQISAVAEKLDAIIKKMDISSLNTIGQSHINKIRKSLRAIKSADNLERQRQYFVNFNENFIPLIMSFEHLLMELYVQKCPMAANNKGASWLSGQKIIKNPYYGEAMITCGSVIDSIN